MTRRSLRETLAQLPPEYPESLMGRIRAEFEASCQTLVVLDDDPTGTQTVYDVPVLTEWSVSSLVREFRAGIPVVYLLTNSRSLSPKDARQLAFGLAMNLQDAADHTVCDYRIVSRSDSTLRGHYPDEVNALALALNLDKLPHILIPFFAEGGRLTLDDVHYVVEGDEMIPVAETPFARDATFGFRHSNLREWVEEKTQGSMPASQVRSLGLEPLRKGDFDAVTAWLEALPERGVGIVNAVSLRDLEVFVVGLQAAEDKGRKFIFRTAASFVQARAGLPPKPPLSGAELARPGREGGLFVVGSHVPKTTRQLEALCETAGPALARVELDVESLLADAETTARRAAEEVDGHLAAGRDTVLHTSRRLVEGDDAESSLAIARRVSAGLVDTLKRLRHAPRFLVAKGGITSSDVATQALGVKRAMVRGQALPGVPVWELGQESRYPGLPYIVFPGNVGSETALADLWQRLRETHTTA